MRKCLYFMALCLVFAAVAQGLRAEPKPSPFPVSWELKFRFMDPVKVSVFLPGQSDPVVYWYMLYTVENGTDREVDFFPRFDLVTDTLQVIPSEIRVSPEAFQAIKRRSGDPLLLPPEKTTGRLLRGADQARHGVAVWRDFDPQVREFKIYVGGLSGEFVRVRNAAFDAERAEGEDNPRYFTLRKTLEIPYKLPGSVQTRRLATPERIADEQKWVMR